ncbi:MAG: cobalamin-binding protein [Desulfuromonadales bacterium]|nr:cobalamin-binding protein [Desulfuromonadales bacterium]
MNRSAHPLRGVIAGSLLLLLLILGGLPASATATATTRELIDLTGRTVRLPAEPQRVVSLAPSITELVFALGRQGLLQGTTQYSSHPPAARELPVVGSYIHPDLERIVALRPDLVLATRDGNPKQTIVQLERLGIPVFAVDPRTLAEIMQTITALGEVLNAQPQAAALVTGMSERIDRVRRTVAGADSRPSVFFQVDAAPIVSVGEQTFIHELIVLAGGRNATAGLSPYPRLGWEEILHLQPEIVIITSMAGGHTPQGLLEAWQRWPQLQAVRNGRLHVVEADLFDRPTDRLVSGLEILARIIHPDLFPARP